MSRFSVKSLTPFNLSARMIAISDFLTISDKFNLSYSQEKELRITCNGKHVGYNY